MRKHELNWIVRPLPELLRQYQECTITDVIETAKLNRELDILAIVASNPQTMTTAVNSSAVCFFRDPNVNTMVLFTKDGTVSGVVNGSFEYSNNRRNPLAQWIQCVAGTMGKVANDVLPGVPLTGHKITALTLFVKHPGLKMTVDLQSMVSGLGDPRFRMTRGVAFFDLHEICTTSISQDGDMCVNGCNLTDRAFRDIVEYIHNVMAQHTTIFDIL